MTDGEKEAVFDQRLEYLTKTHEAGDFEVFFDDEACAAVIKSGNSMLMIPSEQLKTLAGTLQQLDMTLFLVGITQ